MKTRTELQRALNRIEARLPHLLEHFPEPEDFWPAFAGETEIVVECAGYDHAWVSEKLENMLAFHGAPSP